MNPTNFKQYESLKSGAKLKIIKEIKDLSLLKEIQTKIKRKVLLRSVAARIQKLTNQKEPNKKSIPKKAVVKKPSVPKAKTDSPAV